MNTLAENYGTRFPDFLKDWRARRKMSQLDLAMAANLSQRHISFLETGRSNPTVSSIQCLSRALEMPATEFDAMLISAGYSSHSDFSQLDETSQKAIDASIDYVLEGHNPYPAIAIDAKWNLQKANDSAMTFFQRISDQKETNVLRYFLKPGKIRNSIDNWESVTRSLMRLFEMEVVRRPSDTEAQKLLTELRAIEEVARIMESSSPDFQPPVMTIRFNLDGAQVSLFSLIATIGMCADARLDDIRIETLLPADESSRIWFENQFK